MLRVFNGVNSRFIKHGVESSQQPSRVEVGIPVSQKGTLRCRGISEIPTTTSIARLALCRSLSAQSPCLFCFFPPLMRAVSRAQAHFLNPVDAGER